jgi:hypothetical protein
VGQIKDASSICPLLDGEPLTAVAIAVEIVVADQDHVVGFGPRLSA